MQAVKEVAKRGRYVRIRGILVRVAEFGLEDVVYEWKPCPKRKQQRDDRSEVDGAKPEGVQ